MCAGVRDDDDIVGAGCGGPAVGCWSGPALAYDDGVAPQTPRRIVVGVHAAHANGVAGAGGAEPAAGDIDGGDGRGGREGGARQTEAAAGGAAGTEHLGAGRDTGDVGVGEDAVGAPRQLHADPLRCVLGRGDELARIGGAEAVDGAGVVEHADMECAGGGVDDAADGRQCGRGRFGAPLEPDAPEAAVGAGDHGVLRPLPGDDGQRLVVELERVAAAPGAREPRGGVGDQGVENERRRRANPEIGGGAEHAAGRDVARRRCRRRRQRVRRRGEQCACGLFLDHEMSQYYFWNT